MFKRHVLSDCLLYGKACCKKRFIKKLPVFYERFYVNDLFKLIDKMFKRRLSAYLLEKTREFLRDPVLKDMRRYMGNPSYSYVHIEVDLAGASSLLCIEPETISTLGVLSFAPPQLR